MRKGSCVAMPAKVDARFRLAMMGLSGSKELNVARYGAVPLYLLGCWDVRGKVRGRCVPAQTGLYFVHQTFRQGGPA
jgi:hypothetical protein